MLGVLLSTVLLATASCARPSSKLSLATEPVFKAPIWGAPCLTEADDGSYYSFATNMYHCNVPQAHSTDFSNWEFVQDKAGKNKDAMPQLPSWVEASGPKLWAPDVSKLNSTHWIMYFTAISKQTGTHCIGAAYSDCITGPYTSFQKAGKDAPWFCGADTDQAIDPDGFLDKDGKRYVLWKHNMKNKAVHASHHAWYNDKALSSVDQKTGQTPISAKCGSQGPPYGPTPIKIQEVDPRDGVTKIGNYTILLDNRGYADLGNSESPTLMRADNGNYFLFFAHGCFMDQTYATSYAVSRNGVKGPYTRNFVPLLSVGSPAGYRLSGPGTLDVLNEGKLGVFFSHEPDNMEKRPMRTVSFHVEGNRVVIDQI